MLEVALRRSRATPDLQVAFQKLDAQTCDLGYGRFDAAFSRFGVMFFSDPVAAFANIRASLKPGGRLGEYRADAIHGRNNSESNTRNEQAVFDCAHGDECRLVE
jgi:ubiquinone/menaquinone biosynthesis C-methylase UbiE